MSTIRHVWLLVLLLIGAAFSSASAQVWQRQAFGQGPFYYGCGQHDGDPLFAFYYPNNNLWSQEKQIYAPPGATCETITAPSNWSTDRYPGHDTQGSDNAVIGNGGAPGTFCDVRVVLNNLTITPTGQFNMGAGSGITANFFNFQGNNDADATLTVGGGGGAAPYLVVPAGGTMKKTTGSRTFQLAADLVVQAINGGTIACDAGALQLPGASQYVGPLQPTTTPFNFDAATGALIDLAPAGAVDSGAIQMTGYFTGINTGGTVRLSKGWLSTVSNSGGATLNFGGDTFQWTGGSFASQAADPFVNVGTINITGPVNPRGIGFINQGTITQSGAGQLNLPAGAGLTNSASGIIDLRNDTGWIGVGGGGATGFFKNSGLVKKSAGSGKATIDNNVVVDNIGGTIDVESGTLALGHGLVTDGGPGDGGQFIVAPGATLELSDETNTALYNGTYTASGGGTILLSAGAIEAVRFYNGATFNFPGAMFQWSGGTINSGNGQPLINAGNVTVTGPVHTYNYGSGFTNTGNLIQVGNGALSSERNATTNGAGGVWDIRNDQGYTGADFVNSGTFQKSAGAGTSIIDGGQFNNSGTINAITGTLQFTNLVQTAGVTNLNGGNIASPNDITLNGGTLAGSGQISGSLRNNSGVVSPGHSPGSINITGNYLQGAAGALDIQIGGAVAGTEYDQVVVGGTAALNGTLNISTINGYRPAVGDVLTIIAAQSFTGAFSQVNANGLGVQINYASGAITATVTSVPEILLNISTRLNVQTGDDVLIGGFIVTGTEPKKVIVRGIGPSLTGISGALQNPTLELIDGEGVTLASNDDWKESQRSEIETSGVAPTKDAEAAIVRTLDPGAYTAVLRGKDNSTGIGLLDLYDLGQAAKSKLANISSRGLVATGDDALIGGFIVGGGNGIDAKVVVRAIGPSLAPAVSGALADPTLELIDANGSTIRSNDNWQSDQKSELETIGLQPSNDLESAVVATLPAGGYTAVVRGATNGTGLAVVEIYNVD